MWQENEASGHTSAVSQEGERSRAVLQLDLTFHPQKGIKYSVQNFRTQDGATQRNASRWFQVYQVDTIDRNTPYLVIPLSLGVLSNDS